MNVRIGTAGFTYPHWKGVFYPTGIKTADWLSFYGSQFDTIELNVTFYRSVKDETYRKWYDTVPPGFLFSAKMNRFITHIRRLNVERDSVERFLKSVSTLGDRLGAILIQTPPSLVFDADLVTDFLDSLDPSLRYAVEARNKSFVDDRFFSLLEKRNMAWCISDTAGRFPYSETITADFVYVRLHGKEELYCTSYRDEDLEEFKKKITAWGRDAYIYFDNDYGGYAPTNALTLKRMFQE
jgi:uncharacterized protein YecE (DUF72 family)